jgi:hypothetical protein
MYGELSFSVVLVDVLMTASGKSSSSEAPTGLVRQRVNGNRMYTATSKILLLLILHGILTSSTQKTTETAVLRREDIIAI